jgi:hypothetical protein
MYKIIGGAADHGHTGVSNDILGRIIAGRYEVTTAVNAMRVLFSTGNITSGTVRIYGIAK